jgi:prepilin-type N-terminal cleavage/methylation domain-containing protein
MLIRKNNPIFNSIAPNREGLLFAKRKSPSLRSLRGFTLVELVIVIVIVAILVSLITYAIDVRSDAQTKALNGTIKTLNEALLRAKLSDDSFAGNPGTAPGYYGKEAALNWYLNQGYISYQGTLNIDKVDFSPSAAAWVVKTNAP